MKLVDYEIIEGKPYGGLFFSRYFTINPLQGKEIEKDPIYQIHIEKLRLSYYNYENTLQIRKEQVIYGPPYFANPMLQNAIIGIKYMVWGRAFKVMKLTKKNKKAYKKVYVSGKRKRVRIR